MDLVKASLEYVFDASLRVHDGAKPCFTFKFFCRRSCHFVRGFCAAACPAAAAHHHQVGRMLCAGPMQPHYDQFRRMCCPAAVPRAISVDELSIAHAALVQIWAMRTHFFGLLLLLVYYNR